MRFDAVFERKEDMPARIGGCGRRSLGLGVNWDMMAVYVTSTEHRLDGLSERIVAV